MKRKILVIDVGGSHVKLMISREERRKFKSGSRLTPRELISQCRPLLEGWDFDAITMGFPAPVRDGRILTEPKNLGRGWMRFDFEKAFRKPLRVINDAALQALGSYRGGKMLFLGLGTGLGSALVWQDHILSLELGDLPYRDRRIIEDFLGKAGIEELGEKEWKREVFYAVKQLKKAVIADYVVLGGGSTKKLSKLPDDVEPGHNRNVFLGGERLWQIDRRTRRQKWRIM